MREDQDLLDSEDELAPEEIQRLMQLGDGYVLRTLVKKAINGKLDGQNLKAYLDLKRYLTPKKAPEPSAIPKGPERPLPFPTSTQVSEQVSEAP